MHRSTSLSMLALALTCIAQPSAAQDAGSCVDEVQRLSEGLPVVDAGGREGAADIAQEPGARRGASLGEEQRQQIADLVQQARTAGEQGDGGRCMQSLTEARALLREAGLGSTQPGTASDAGLGTGLVGSGTPGVAGGAGSPVTPPGGAGPATTGAGAAGGAGTVGGGTTAGSATGLPAGGGGTGGGALGGAGGGTAGGGAAGGGMGGGAGGSGGGTR
jgi:Spy/CpxP family protein refolding chaperone